MIKRIFTAVLILWVCGLVSANPNVITRDLKIYKVDAPPVIDGSASDRCWQNASCAKGFMLIMQEGKKAKEATETYICYDAENLYLLWKVYESNMRKMEEDLKETKEVSKLQAQRLLDQKYKLDLLEKRFAEFTEGRSVFDTEDNKFYEGNKPLETPDLKKSLKIVPEVNS